MKNSPMMLGIKIVAVAVSLGVCAYLVRGEHRRANPNVPVEPAEPADVPDSPDAPLLDAQDQEHDASPNDGTFIMGSKSLALSPSESASVSDLPTPPQQFLYSSKSATLPSVLPPLTPAKPEPRAFIGSTKSTVTIQLPEVEIEKKPAPAKPVQNGVDG